MKSFTALWRALVGRRRLERDLDDELSASLASLEEDLIRRGMLPAEARRRARIRLGGVEQVKERVREARTGAALEQLAADVRSGVRLLKRNPGLSLIVVLTLGLGLAASISIFSVVDTTLLSGLPYPEAERLVFLWSDSESGYRRSPLSGPEMQDMAATAGIARLGAIWSSTAELSGDGDEPRLLKLGMVTADFFPVLGVEPALGRVFEPAEDGSGAPVVLLSHGLWQSRFAADPSIVGRSIRMDDREMEVIGVMPASFRLWLPPDSSVPHRQDAWIPFHRPVQDWPRNMAFLRCVGRLARGVNLAALNQELAVLSRELVTRHSEYTSPDRIFYARALASESVLSFRTALLAVLGGGILVLLITCVNSAALLVGRALQQRPRTAMQLALGASYGRLLRQALVEGWVLAALGGLAGVLLTLLLLEVLAALQPPGLVDYELARLRPAAVLFGAGLVVFCASMFAIVPFLETRRVDPIGAIQRQGRGGRSALGRRTRGFLVATEVALGVVVLVGAGLIGQTMLRLQQVDPGYRGDQAITFKMSLSRLRYSTVRDQGEVVKRVAERLRTIPGVEEAGAISVLPLDTLPNWSSGYLLRGAEDLDQRLEADMRAVGPGYFEAIGATLVEGRGFTEHDDSESAPVAVIDEMLARRISPSWPATSAVGAQVEVDFLEVVGFTRKWANVVGVVRHLRHRELRSQVREQVYLPYAQSPRTPVAFVLRTRLPPSSLADQIRAEVRRVDPGLPIADLRPLSTYLDDSMAELRFIFVLSAAFAGIGLLLSCLGVYGVVSYSVRERRGEIGVRMAMGATPTRIVRQVLKEGICLTGIGLAAGLVLAAAVSGAISGLLYEVTAADPVTYGVAALVLVAVSLLACVRPARLASGVDPLRLLR